LIALDTQHCGIKIGDSKSICSALHDFGFLSVAIYGKAKQKCGKYGTRIQKSIYTGNISLFIPSYRYSCFEKHNSA
jgi:hypothetical protein